MPKLDFSVFESLGDKTRNWETLCRALVRLHFEEFGEFVAYKNHAGVEFSLKLAKAGSALGAPPREFGWQCKWHTLTTKGALTSAAKRDVEDSIEKTLKYWPEITDWVLWTPYSLAMQDQIWCRSVTNKLKFRFWTDQELDTYLSGPGLMLRETYFGELVLLPEELESQHKKSVCQIGGRWMHPVHQTVDAEREIRRALWQSTVWEDILAVASKIAEDEGHTINILSNWRLDLSDKVAPLLLACKEVSSFLIAFYAAIESGDLGYLKESLPLEFKFDFKEINTIPAMLRVKNCPAAIYATNALADLRLAQTLLQDVREFLDEGVIAVVADAGGGKTQMAAELSSAQGDRPAGILLHGRNFHKEHTLDDLARRYSINRNPVTSIERLIAALDCAAKRANCRLPLVIDGLNEAEDVRKWKPELASLSEVMKKYSNVLVVCTLRPGEKQQTTGQFRSERTSIRDSFVERALPAEIRTVESEGFGGDVSGAINSYFEYYKIYTTDIDVPTELFQIPLMLRIFCEVKNSSRASPIEIEHFPASLTALWHGYITEACQRISDMHSRSMTLQEVLKHVNQLGLLMWESRKREVSESEFRNLIADQSNWEGSLIHMLVQEGIIIRNPGDESYEYVLVPAFDELAGYIIADALLSMNRHDKNYSWLQEASFLDAFIGEKRHEFAQDIFIALTSILPHQGRHLWEVGPERFKNAALSCTVYLDTSLIDAGTVDAFGTLLRQDSERRIESFRVLQRIRGASNHPYNAEFLDTLLRSLSIPERDLSWTEWVRRSRRERIRDLKAAEEKWKLDLESRTLSDRLRLKWIMWLLTSSDHELRDLATRAIYWYGRGASEALFDEALNSLEINDPYVPERMLAASYGVAMAHYSHFADGDLLTICYCAFARKIFDALFYDNAPNQTTHILIRDYAMRIVELAAACDESVFSEEELVKCRPPFSGDFNSDWGESLKTDCGLDSPFRMDFENYTIGGLVPGRRNYDYKHEGYQKIRAMILWRIEQLGWNYDSFKLIDEEIVRARPSSRSASGSKRIDRYGKKYSWIAYFEMVGYQHDLQNLDRIEETGRGPDVDIDPSFPDAPLDVRVISSDLLGDPAMPMDKWIQEGPAPDLTPYLRLDSLNDEEGPWIMLDGTVTQNDESRGRQIFCFLRSFLISRDQSLELIDLMLKQNLANRWLPEKPSVIYTFAGEIPWCITYPIQEEVLFSFHVSDQPETFRGRQKSFSAVIPVCDFGWEGYQSITSPSHYITLPCKEMISKLNLVGRPQTFDLFRRNGKRATRCIYHSDQNIGHQSMLYMRVDALNEYLLANDLSLILAGWGEREYSSKVAEEWLAGAKRPPITYKEFSFAELFRFGNTQDDRSI